MKPDDEDDFEEACPDCGEPVSRCRCHDEDEEPESLDEDDLDEEDE